MREEIPLTPKQEEFKGKLEVWAQQYPDLSEDCKWLHGRYEKPMCDSITSYMIDQMYLHIVRTLRYKHHVPLQDIVGST